MGKGVRYSRQMLGSPDVLDWRESARERTAGGWAGALRRTGSRKGWLSGARFLTARRAPDGPVASSGGVRPRVGGQWP